MQESVKRKIIFFWLTHSYLRRIGKRYPDHFKQLILDITDNHSQQSVMFQRYIENKKFEVIALDMNVDASYVFRLHKKVLEKIIGN